MEERRHAMRITFTCAYKQSVRRTTKLTRDMNDQPPKKTQPMASGAAICSSLSLLEKWRNAHKSHAVEVCADNGYGASCWAVSLTRGQHFVLCHEVNFWKGPDRQQADGNLIVCVPDNGDFPGLAATIEYAVKCAEEFFKTSVL